MKRTISAEVGKGSVNHNSRKFKAANVDPDRTHLNVEYCNEPIKQVYHKLFDEALERYNAKQTRSDRRIENYYEKIRAGKQEKPFHELIIQIGNRDDTGSGTEIGEQAKVALDEYFQGFRERNPNLYVFSAHLHMDEATPHMHIDFVPFTTGSKRGLDTRVSLKQALAAQGFRGGTRGATEWNQWVLSEKEELAIAMFRHGFEWEQKGSHEEHLSVIDYKKQERTKELAAVEEKLADKSSEFNCNERIQTVYHQLFDEALKRYNEKQARSDRRIPNYYEKIRSGNQEKPFHEIILQIGNKENMSATGEYAELARTVLDEYYRGFQERNPNLQVFSAHLHMDEATPHLHIDFVPFTTGSKRGLDTRVSLKQALAVQGFKGGTRGATEWAQWVQSEKEQLAAVMERYDIQWEQKGTHEKHLSVLDYKKQEREKEIAALDTTLAEKQDELETVQNRIDNFDQGAHSIERLEQRMESDAEFQLPDPPTLMTAKTYKQRVVDPLIKKLKEVIRKVFYHYYQALDSYHRLNTTNGRLYRENEHLTATNDRLKGENDALRSELKDFRFLRKVLGSRQIDNLIAQAKEMEQQRKQNQRTRRRNTNYER